MEDEGMKAEDMEQVPLVREFGRRWGEKRPEKLAEALKTAKLSLEHLASYARIAIHIGEFSPKAQQKIV
jgi:hypothetical protein